MLALVLFMYSALQVEDCDLIILDDPVSSFDGNKQFAVLNMLFMGEKCFRDRTVLVLTHEFNFVIDAVYVMHGQIHPRPYATFLSTDREGVLTGKKITKSEIGSAVEIARHNVEHASNLICQLFFAAFTRDSRVKVTLGNYCQMYSKNGRPRVSKQ